MIGERERCYRKGWDVGRGRGAIGREGGAIGRVGMIGERERCYRKGRRCYRKGWDDRGEGEVL